MEMITASSFQNTNYKRKSPTNVNLHGQDLAPIIGGDTQS